MVPGNKVEGVGVCVFYDIRGNKIEKREFIELYSSIYYYLNDFEIESSIEKLIFHTEERTSEDFVTFLRWKVGGKDYGKHILSRYGKIDITAVKELANEIDDSWVSLSASELYTKIISKDIKNL